MLVLRVEEKGNRFNGRSFHTRVAEKAWSRLPTPAMDGINTWIAEAKFTNGKWYCATKDIKQFKIWWKLSKINKLKHDRVAILDVPDNRVYEGGYQVIIDRHKARIVGTIDSKGKPTWTKELKHSSTTEKERLFLLGKTPTQNPIPSKQDMLIKSDKIRKSSYMQKSMQSFVVPTSIGRTVSS